MYDGAFVKYCAKLIRAAVEEVKVASVKTFREVSVGMLAPSITDTIRFVTDAPALLLADIWTS